MIITVVLSPKTEERLDFLVSQTSLSKSYLLREAVERGLDDVEDYYLAVEVLQRVRDGREQLYTAEEVRRDFALDD